MREWADSPPRLRIVRSELRAGRGVLQWPEETAKREMVQAGGNRRPWAEAASSAFAVASALPSAMNSEQIADLFEKVTAPGKTSPWIARMPVVSDRERGRDWAVPADPTWHQAQFGEFVRFIFSFFCSSVFSLKQKTVGLSLSRLAAVVVFRIWQCYAFGIDVYATKKNDNNNNFFLREIVVVMVLHFLHIPTCALQCFFSKFNCTSRC